MNAANAKLMKVHEEEVKTVETEIKGMIEKRMDSPRNNRSSDGSNNSASRKKILRKRTGKGSPGGK